MANIYRDICRTDLTKTCCIAGKRTLSYEGFFRLIHGLAEDLQSKGISVGDRIAVQGLKDIDLLVAFYGCAKAGAVPVPVSYADPGRVQGAIDAANAKLVINSLPEPVLGELDFTARDTEEAMIIFTSGTTSDRLKGVRLSHDGISSTARFMNSAMGVDQTICESVFAALDHAYGFGRCHAVLMTGGCMVLPTNMRNLLGLFRDISQHQCNGLSAPPSVVSTLLKMMPKQFDSLAKNIRWLQTGAMRFDKSFRQALLQALPNAGIFLHYGLSEAMRVTFFELNQYPDKIHTEGPPAEGVELAIFDDDNNPLPNGVEGTVAIRGRNLCLGYLDDDLWQQNCHQDWFVTSDRGMLDQDGFLVFAGRRDDVINVNGVLVHPDEIESHLVELFPGNVYAVVGIPDPAGLRDRIVALAVEGSTELQISDVVKHMQDKDSFLIPVLLTSVDEIPRTRSGKVVRPQLARLISNQ